MDLLENINQNYQSSDDEKVLAPEVPEQAVQALVLKDTITKLTRFETENEI